tara:strand:+ start:189 stop:755 length:567 start_codon:yes stop_codon:yes gene_type:complete
MHKKIPKFFIFLDQYSKIISKNNNTNIGVIYRNYGKQNKEKELIKIAQACKKNRYQLFVSNSTKLAIKYKAQGIYIPSFDKKKSFYNLEKRNIIILGSAHNQKEIKKKINQNCSGIFLSPIFANPKSKKNLDIHKFNYLSNNNKTIIFALGGILQNNMNKLKLLNINGFGGIRIFKKKPAFKRPVFLN